MAQNLLSIIIPVRNQARTLDVLLRRLKALAPPEGWGVEIIAGYTDSRDHTLDVLKAHGVEVVTSTVPGPGAARNAAAARAKGQLLYFIDADACPVGEDFLARLIGIARRLGRFGAFGGPILLDPSQRRNPIALGDHWACWFFWQQVRPSQRTILFQPTVSLVMWRRVFEAFRGFNPALRVLEDAELQERLLARNLPIYFVQGFAVTHQARGGLWRSWRHSWYWGGPFRSEILAKGRSHKLRYPVGSPLFWLNLPKIFRQRMRRILKVAWPHAKREIRFCFPFLAATVFVWALGAVLGRDQPRPETAAPV
ncbi:MAG: glycosyltransferase [Alphaproteobacteria bacterium]